VSVSDVGTALRQNFDGGVTVSPDAGPPWVLSPERSAALDRLIAETVSALAGPLDTGIRRVVAAGGKRLRPALTMAVAQLFGPFDDDVLRLAAAVELLHCATLVHDDLIDDAAVRRGVATVSALEGPGAAILSGDLLIAAAFELAGQTSAQAGIVLARTLAQLCRGEALELSLQLGSAIDADRIVQVAAGKTGALIQAACVLGVPAGRPSGAVADFGMNFGITLQLVDDLLDVLSTPRLAGKPVGTDFASGTMTLPALFALQAHPELGDLIGDGRSEVDRRRALSLLRSPEAIGPSVLMALEHARAAQAALSEVSAPAALLAQWPLRYLRAQLLTKVAPRWSHCLPADEILC
jgi:geranylgeranyl pyrophosphate synthase